MDTSLTAECIVIGAGPAGLNAAAQIAARGHSCIIVEANMSGGHLVMTTAITDYPGIEAVSGYKLSSILLKQAQSKNVTVMTGDKVVTLVQDHQSRYIITLESGTDLYAQCVVLATGLRSVKTGLTEESNFSGKGVSYCAECDGFFFKDKPVVVYGSGDGFAEAVDLLVSTCKPVYHISPSGGCSTKDSVSTFEGWRITALEGDGKLSALRLESQDRKQKRKIEAEGLFVYMGKEPTDELLKPFLEEASDTRMSSQPYSDLARTGLFITGHLAGTETLVETCANGVSTARQVSEYLNRKVKVSLE